MKRTQSRGLGTAALKSIKKKSPNLNAKAPQKWRLKIKCHLKKKFSNRRQLMSKIRKEFNFLSVNMFLVTIRMTTFKLKNRSRHSHLIFTFKLINHAASRITYHWVNRSIWLFPSQRKKNLGEDQKNQNQNDRIIKLII